MEKVAKRNQWKVTEEGLEAVGQSRHPFAHGNDGYRWNPIRWGSSACHYPLTVDV